MQKKALTNFLRCQAIRSWLFAFVAGCTTIAEPDGTSVASPSSDKPAKTTEASTATQPSPLANSANPTSRPKENSTEGTSIGAPEEEIAVAKAELTNLAHKLAAAREINLEKHMEADDLRANAALARAEELAKKKHWLATIRELNSYLNKIQVPEKTPYLRSHYLLGKAYEGLKSPEKAGKAYLRYVATAIDATSEEAPDLSEVIDRLILVASTSSRSSSDLSSLLAALASSNLPQELKPRVLFFAGRSALNHNKQNLAATWLNEAERATQDPVLRNKIAYVQGLILLAREEWDEAEDVFLRISKTEIDPQSRDLARLALARIAVHRRKPEIALKQYAWVPEDSELFHDATFESIYLLLDRKEFVQARNKAVFFLGRFPESRESLQVRVLLAYLDMRAGDLESSEQSIKIADQKLQGISTWLKTNFSGRTSLNHALLLDFLSVTQNSLAPTPTIKEATGLFERIAESARRLADAHGEVQNLYYALARVDPTTIKPAWSERETQIRLLAEEALTIGHKLAASERLLYQSQIDPLTWQRLTASERRRTKISQTPAIKIPEYGRHGDVSRFLRLSNMTAEAYQKFRKAEAELAGARQITKVQDKELGAQESRLRELEDRRKKISQDLQQTLRKLRQSKVEILVGQSAFTNTRRFIRQYSMAIQEEAELLSSVRDANNDSHQRLTSEEAAIAWTAWEGVMKEIFTQLENLEKNVSSDLSEIFSNLEKHESRYSELAGRIKAINAELERRLGLSVPYLIEQYANKISVRYSNHRKWRADIEWLKYQKMVESDDKLTRKRDLEQQILKDNLIDLQQGVSQKWAE